MSTTQETASDVAVRKLQELVQKLTPEAREALAAAGVTVPLGDVAAIISGKHKYGLLCNGCSKIALYFVGTQWEYEGVTYDEPPQMPCDQLSWTQRIPPQKIDRHTPRCQHCGRAVPLNPDRSFVRYRANGVHSDRLKLLSDFNESRDIRYDRKAAREVSKDAAKGASQAHLGDSQSFTTPDVPASAIIDGKHGQGFMQRVEKVMDQAGVTAALGGQPK